MAASTEVISSSAAAVPRSRAPRTAAVGALLLLAVISLQWISGAYRSELGGHPDESSHFITGLMIRDYIVSGFPSGPVAYAESYYAHYPKVGFGMWGPLLHILEASWMLVFPATRVSVLVLIALIAAATAVLLYRVLLPEFGTPLSVAGALLFVSWPTVQAYYGMIMADGLVALLSLCAALAFAAFLREPVHRNALAFGAFVCLSILTKGNGIALIMLPVFAIALTRRFSLVLSRALWAAAAPVLLIGLPWQIYSASLLSGILQRFPPGHFFVFYTQWMLTAAGWVITPLMLAGIYGRVIKPAFENRMRPIWASAVALILSVWLFHVLVPAPAAESRYLIAFIPPMVMFAVAGVDMLAAAVLANQPLGRRRWMAAALLAVAFGATAFSLHRKIYYGFIEVAERLEAPEFKNSVILVSSEGDGEGMLISEMAPREQRPSHLILRASKMMSRSDWNGQSYQPRYKSTGEVMEFLRQVPVEVVVIHHDRFDAEYPHHTLLKQTIAAYPGEWTHLGTFPADEHRRERASIDVYRLTGAAAVHGERRIRIELPFTLQRTIELTWPGK